MNQLSKLCVWNSSLSILAKMKTDEVTIKCERYLFEDFSFFNEALKFTWNTEHLNIIYTDVEAKYILNKINIKNTNLQKNSLNTWLWSLVISTGIHLWTWSACILPKWTSCHLKIMCITCKRPLWPWIWQSNRSFYGVKLIWNNFARCMSTLNIKYFK